MNVDSRKSILQKSFDSFEVRSVQSLQESTVTHVNVNIGKHKILSLTEAF